MWLFGPSDHFFKLAKQLEFTPFPVNRSMPPLQDLTSVIALVRILKKNQIDIVLVHTPKRGLIASQ